MTRYEIAGIPIDAVTVPEVIEAIARPLGTDLATRVGYLNAHVLRLAARDPRLRSSLSRFDLVYCDGVGLRWGLGLLGLRLPARMTTPDFIDDLLQAVGTTRVFLLGDETAVVAAAARRLQANMPGTIVGIHHGYFDTPQEAAVLAAIENARPALVLVGMGSPRQELLIDRLSTLTQGIVWVAVGGLFRWVAGSEPRGPRWLTDNGFEWACRLVTQPRRVAKRYLLGLPQFAGLLFGWRLRGVRPERRRSSSQPAP